MISNWAVFWIFLGVVIIADDIARTLKAAIKADKEIALKKLELSKESQNDENE